MKGEPVRRTIASVASLAMIAGVLVLLAAPAGASCPRGKAGKMTSASGSTAQVFNWHQNAAASFATGEKAKMDLALIPFDGTGSKNIYLFDTNTGSNFVVLSLLNDGSTSAGVNYVPGKWNNIQIVADFDSDTWTVTINGIESAAQSFTEDGSDLTSVSFEYYEDPDGGVPSTGWIDTLKITKVTSAGSVELLDEDFTESPEDGPFQGQLTVMKPATFEAGAGANCPTTTSLTVEKTADAIEASGRVTPPHPGAQVVVKLFKKVAGEFERVRTKRPVLAADSRYEASFSRPNANRCQIVAKFPADDDHLTSGKAKVFDC